MRVSTVPVRDGLAVVELGGLVAPRLHTISPEGPPAFRATSRRVWLLPRTGVLRPGDRHTAGIVYLPGGRGSWSSSRTPTG
ncbi:MAG: hypothetical protein R3C15_18935 [Thermoleophilia bacterium]